jgi:CHAT domain-containing protein
MPCLHFSTHGWAGWGESEVSGLKLADGNLYLRDLFDLRLERARLGILSACESGLPGTELLEEVVSLPASDDAGRGAGRVGVAVGGE